MSLNKGENTCPKRNGDSIHIIIFPCVCQRRHFLLLFFPLKERTQGHAIIPPTLGHLTEYFLSCSHSCSSTSQMQLQGPLGQNHLTSLLNM